MGYKDIDNGIIISATILSSSKILNLRKIPWDLTDISFNYRFVIDLSQISTLKVKMDQLFNLPIACPTLSLTSMLI